LLLILVGKLFFSYPFLLLFLES